MRLLALVVFFGLSLAQSSVLLQGARHEYQRYNNCGPATLGMAMSFWGSRDTQYQIAPALKPNREDKSVEAEDMAAYVRSKGLRFHQGMAGDLGLVKRLIAGGFPVMLETWFVTPDHGGMGHYRLLVGYDDRRGVFNAFDSYYGPKVTLRYAEVDPLWRVFNRAYHVVYPASKAEALRAILGERMDEGTELRLALEAARRETQARPSDASAWFNLGTSLMHSGDAKGAAEAFDQSRKIAPDRRLDPRRPANAASNWPWRMLWYQFGPLEAYHKTGRYADVVRLTGDVLRRVGDHEEAYYWRGMARKSQGDLAGARSDFQAALKFCPSYQAARTALQETASR